MQTVHDWIVARYPAPGWFVEAGAHDGVGDSATYRLEQMGWTGLCIEPSSSFDGLRASRDCRVDNRALWWESGAEVEFLEVAGEAIELSGIGSTFISRAKGPALKHAIRRVKTVTLTDALAEHGAPPYIEFLTLDTEGSELVILEAHDFGRFRFGAISVEHNSDPARREAMRRLLSARGYALAVPNAWDIEDWFTWEAPDGA